MIPPMVPLVPMMHMFLVRPNSVALEDSVRLVKWVLIAHISILFLVKISSACLPIDMPKFLDLPRILVTVAITLLAGTVLKELQK